MNRRPSRENSQDKFNRHFHFVMNKPLFLLYYYHYYLHLCQLFPLILILNPYGSHIVMGGQHWNHRGPWEPFGPQLCILTLSLFQDFFIFISGSHILEFIFILIEYYQYGTCTGLIWAKKPIWGPFRTLMG